MQDKQRGYIGSNRALRHSNAQVALRSRSAPARPSTDTSTELNRQMDRDVYCFLGLPFDATDLHSACKDIDKAIDTGQKLVVSTPNVHFLANAAKDSEFRQCITASHLSIVDGMPITWGAKLLGLPLRNRVAGSDLFDQLRSRLVRKPISTYLFGGPKGAAQRAADRVNNRSRSMQVCGSFSPPFAPLSELSEQSYLDAINDADPDFLVLSLGAAKGLKWIHRNQSSLNVPVISHLGAVVNFTAGTVRRAPSWMRKTGFEWMWRILAEPQLARRYFGDAFALMRFLLTCLMPHARWLKRHREDIALAPEPAISSQRDGDTHHIRVDGYVTHEHSNLLRQALKDAPLNEDTQVDLSHAKYLSSQAIALLILRQALAVEAGKAFHCVNASRGLKRLFRWNLANYLFDA